MSSDGELLGVITGFKTNWLGMHNAKLVCAPSQDLVESIVAADRNNPKAPPALATPYPSRSD